MQFKMKKLGLSILIVCCSLIGKAQIFSTPAVDSGRVGNANGTSGIALYGDIYLKNTVAGLLRLNSDRKFVSTTLTSSDIPSLAISKITGLQTALDGKVSLTGNEHISGIKTLDSVLIIKKNPTLQSYDWIELKDGGDTTMFSIGEIASGARGQYAIKLIAPDNNKDLEFAMVRNNHGTLRSEGGYFYLPRNTTNLQWTARHNNLSNTLFTVYGLSGHFAIGNSGIDSTKMLTVAGSIKAVDTLFQKFTSGITKYTTGGALIQAISGTDYVLPAGNVATATALQTARTIGILTGDVTSSGSSFEGTGNNTNTTTLATVNSNVGSFGSSTSIPSFTVNAKGLITAASGNAVVAPAGTLTGTTLASNVVGSSLTSVGTISTGTWQGTAIADTYISSAATWNAKQAALSGTGLVKSTAGTISYITDNSSNWNTAYTYSQVGHLPLAGGTLTGRLNGVVGGTAFNTAGLWLQGSGSTDGIAIGGVAGSYKNINVYGGNLKINEITGNGVDIGGALAVTGNISAANLTSGTYTPTTTNVSNATSSTPTTFRYSRIGNEVTISGRVSITSTGTGNGTVAFSLPSGVTSNFTATDDATGGGNGQNSANTIGGVWIDSDATNDRININYTATVATTAVIGFTAMYTVK